MIEAILTLMVLGVLFGVGLFFASRVFHVVEDPRIQHVLEALPGANCGACGQPGCGGFARAVVHGSADPSACIPGGCEVAEQVAALLGVEVEAREEKVAIVHCGGRDVPDRFRYDGPLDCVAASLIQGGPKACTYGCMGFGTCAEACPFDAIEIKDGLPVVDEEKCTACGVCVAACPKNIIELRSTKNHVHVLCRSRDKGGFVRKICATGCIGCKKCEKACEKFCAIEVRDNLAEIDYEKCVSCALCVKACPQGTIANLRPARRARQKAKKEREAAAAVVAETET